MESFYSIVWKHGGVYLLLSGCRCFSRIYCRPVYHYLKCMAVGYYRTISQCVHLRLFPSRNGENWHYPSWEKYLKLPEYSDFIDICFQAGPDLCFCKVFKGGGKQSRIFSSKKHPILSKGPVNIFRQDSSDFFV